MEELEKRRVAPEAQGVCFSGLVSGFQRSRFRGLGSGNIMYVLLKWVSDNTFVGSYGVQGQGLHESLVVLTRQTLILVGQTCSCDEKFMIALPSR